MTTMIDAPGDYLLGRADAVRLPLADRSVDAVVGSPPYTDARLYLEDGRDLGIARGCEAWIEWMLAVTAEAQRVSKGPVVWVAGGVTRGRNYQPACEGLMYRWWQRGGECHLYRPCYWHRSGIPGNGGDDWFRADVEYCLCFKRPGPLPWSDNTAMGHLPVCHVGGPIAYRTKDGSRVDRPAKRGVGGRRVAGHSKYYETWALTRGYTQPDLANPGNLIRTPGGHVGSQAAHESEAPYHVAVPEFFICSVVPPGGIVLDPFGGSGTTVEAALKHGRRAIGFDLRESQCSIARQRIARPHAPVPRRGRPAGPDAAPLLAHLDREDGSCP